MIKKEDLSIRSLAHIGDAVYEVFIREITVVQTQNTKRLHEMTVKLVNAQFQADLLEKLQPILTDEERELVRRGRNTSVTTARRTNHTLHRLSTAFEALIGYLYLNDQNRLEELLSYIKNSSINLQ